MTSDTPSVAQNVGARLRELRLRSGRTQAQLSATTGISESTLSRLESGQRKPTLELLLALSSAHDVTIDDLVHAPAADDPRLDQRPFTRHGRTFVPLSRTAGGLQAFKVTIPGRAGDEQLEQRSHEGFDWFYVLSGRLRLMLGDHDMILGVGEVAEFDTRVPHAFGSAGPDPTEILSLFGQTGERIHVRASTIR
ncbi:helix-turn-helix domain-containing protein [Cryobacterium sp. N22]|uniref:helix-turn-helix domain-containing protein n=1 Tax=Cryobacterium sp. N22 TaxID=2048290 RepID=UPI000CE54DEA|nr:XRE family transcriptional regulator [Cryobacterium sp. N22]